MSEQILTFYLGGLRLGIELEKVKEINRHIQFTPVPDTSEQIIGLLNLRGQVVTLFNLPNLLDMRASAPSQSQNCIILKLQEQESDYLGFIMDHADSVIEVDEGMCEPSPKHMKDLNPKTIKKIAKLDDGLLMVIDYELLRAKLKSG